MYILNTSGNDDIEALRAHFWDAGEYMDLLVDNRYRPIANGMHSLIESGITGKDRLGNVIYEFSSAMHIPNDYFEHPQFSVLLPPLSPDAAKLIKCGRKKVLLKLNVVRRNLEKHPEIRDNRGVLASAIYNISVILYNRPQSRPGYRVVARYGTYVDMATLDITSSNRFIEVVDWRHLSIDNFNSMVDSVTLEGGTFKFLKF